MIDGYEVDVSVREAGAVDGLAKSSVRAGDSLLSLTSFTDDTYTL